MARSVRRSVETPDVTAINLRRALFRLEQKILVAPDPRLTRSSFERTKTSANLEYARTLLLRLEHESSALKVQSRKRDGQNTLLAQRALIKRLTERLHELENLDPDMYTSESEGEDLLEEQAKSAIASNVSSVAPLGHDHVDQTPQPHVESDLRSRHRSPKPALSSFGTSTALPPNPTAQLLETNSTEQMDLTASMVSLVAQLKSSTLAFSSSLDLDNEALARAQEGLEKNETGLEAAGKRIGLLRRMSEGKGWWGRMMLYAWIGGLWIVAIAIVFVGPKFRF
ncbi:MAG: hypothetical protein LQ341_003662 [Variospora aurantia]|nr:MAG: hypothetical protein LQ341_003662 [Variospora aurantia]